MANDILMRLEAEARGFRATIAESVSGLEKLATALLQTSKASQTTASASAQMQTTWAANAAGITAVASSLTAAMEVFRTFGGVALGTLKEVGGQVVSMIGEFAEFDAAMRSIGAAAGVQDYSKLAGDIMQLGIASEFTTKEVQGGALALAQMGANEATLKPLLATVIKIAGATKTDLTRAAEIAAAQMTVFGMSVKDVSQLSTVFIQASGKSQATVEKLGTALSYAGRSGASLGQDIYEVVPALEALIDSGADASQAGTSLRDLFLDLATASPKLKQQLDALVGGFEKVNPATQRLTTIVENFAKAGFTATQAYELFGKGGGSALASLMKAAHGGKLGAEALREYAKELRDSGEAEASVAQIRGGVAFQWDAILAAVESARIVFGGAIAESLGLGEALEKIATKAGNLVTALSALSSAELRDISLKLIGPESLAGLQAAIVEMAGPLSQVMMDAGLLLARQIITYSPMIAANLATAFIDGILALQPLLAQAIVSVAADFVTVMIGGIRNAAGELFDSMMEAASAQLVATANQLPATMRGPLLDAALALKSAGVDIRKSIEEGSDSLAVQGRVFAQAAGDTAREMVAPLREAIRLTPAQNRQMVVAGGQAADAALGKDAGRLAGLGRSLAAVGATAERQVNAGLDALARMGAGRGAVRAAEFQPAGSLATDMANLSLAIAKLADFAQRPAEDREKATRQLMQQQQAEAQARVQAADLAAARAKQEAIQSAVDPRILQGLRAEPGEATPPPVNNFYTDNSFKTIYGAMNSERLRGPRGVQGEQRAQRGTGTGAR